MYHQLTPSTVPHTGTIVVTVQGAPFQPTTSQHGVRCRFLGGCACVCFVYGCVSRVCICVSMWMHGFSERERERLARSRACRLPPACMHQCMHSCARDGLHMWNLCALACMCMYVCMCIYMYMHMHTYTHNTCIAVGF